MADEHEQIELFELPHTGELVHKSATDMLVSTQLHDEPVFVLRAKDIFSVPTLIHYMEQVERLGPTNEDFAEDIRKIAKAFQSWQREHPGQVRYPD